MKGKKECKHEWVNVPLRVNGFTREARKCTKCPLYQFDTETEGLHNARILPFSGFDEQTTF